jgi:ferredoxin
VSDRKMQRDSIKQLQCDFDAVLLAVGQISDADGELLGVDTSKHKVKIGRDDFSTSQAGIFAAGRCTRTACQCVRAAADGKEAADAIQAILLGTDKKLKSQYNHQMGRLEPEELELFVKHVSDQRRIESVNMTAGMTIEQAQAESERCLHCDCRKADCCGLRDLATELEARRTVWPGPRKLFEQITSSETVLYEPGKCVKCGLCVQTAKKAGQENGLSFEGRGFKMEIAVPLGKRLDEGLQKAAAACVKICPTGALSFKKDNN